MDKFASGTCLRRGTGTQPDTLWVRQFTFTGQALSLAAPHSTTGAGLPGRDRSRSTILSTSATHLSRSSFTTV